MANIKKRSDKKKTPLHVAKKVVAGVKTKLADSRAVSPHRAFRLTRKSEIPRLKTMPNWWRLTVRTFALLRAELPKIIVLTLIYAPIAWMITGFYAQDFGNFKMALELVGEGATNGFEFSAFEEALVLFGGFFTSQGARIPQDSLVVINLVTILFWLSFLWIARYAIARKTTTLREAIYTSGTALVPFVLVLLVFIIQALPILLATIIFSGLSGGGFSEAPAEVAMLITLGLLLIVLSFYLMTSTFIALQISALPGMYPWRALKSARKLVIGRRLAVLRKIIMMAVLLLLAWLVLFVPALVTDNAICGSEGACWSTNTTLPLYFYLLSGLMLSFASTYIYMMYRALLDVEDGAGNDR